MATIELIDFYADWCAPCVHMKPIIEEIKKEFGDKLTVTEVDVDQNPDFAGQYNVLSLPTFIIKKDGKITDQFIGAQAKETLVSKLR